jgi:hypothetical protein
LNNGKLALDAKNHCPRDEPQAACPGTKVIGCRRHFVIPAPSDGHDLNLNDWGRALALKYSFGRWCLGRHGSGLDITGSSCAEPMRPIIGQFNSLIGQMSLKFLWLRVKIVSHANHRCGIALLSAAAGGHVHSRGRSKAAF